MAAGDLVEVAEGWQLPVGGALHRADASAVLGEPFAALACVELGGFDHSVAVAVVKG